MCLVAIVLTVFRGTHQYGEPLTHWGDERLCAELPHLLRDLAGLNYGVVVLEIVMKGTMSAEAVSPM